MEYVGRRWDNPLAKSTLYSDRLLTAGQIASTAAKRNVPIVRKILVWAPRREAGWPAETMGIMAGRSLHATSRCGDQRVARTSHPESEYHVESA